MRCVGRLAALTGLWGLSLLAVMALAGHFDPRPRPGFERFPGDRLAWMVAAVWIWWEDYKRAPSPRLGPAVLVSRTLRVIVGIGWALACMLPADFAEQWAAGL